MTKLAKILVAPIVGGSLFIVAWTSNEATVNTEQAAMENSVSLSSDLSAADATSEDVWRSLLYPADWSSAQTTSDGYFLHDFSFAGYHNSEAAWPVNEPNVVVDVVAQLGADNTGASDVTSIVQDAIEMGASGEGLVVYFPPGLYKFDGEIHIPYDGVILRGAGSEESQLYFTSSEDLNYGSHITFKKSLQTNLEIPLTLDGENRSAFVEVADVSDLQVGDDISIGWVITPEFIEEHNMTGTWEAFNDTWQPFFWREILEIDTSVSPNRVYVDVPLRYDSKVRDSASIRRYSGYLSECGIEHMAVGNAVAWADAWAQTQVHVLEMSGVKDCWVDDVKSFSPPSAPESGWGVGYHLQSSGIAVKLSKRVTIANSRMEKAENRGGGGNGYLFEVRQSSELLTRDSVARAGRHNFIQNWGFGLTGCVWLRVDSKGSRAVYSAEYPLPKPAFSEFHHSLATANLIDQSRFDDGWSIKNRHDWSSGAGNTGTQNVVWNMSGVGILESLQFGDGYVIGTSESVYVRSKLQSKGAMDTAPEDYVEGLKKGASLMPQSLFEDQLQHRASAP